MPKTENKNSAGQAVRPPVVVVLGHIDHGKSSLLEAIKDFKITSKESGGITQHISAYQVEEKGKLITFLDTPGHEAFSKMRSRGAKVADIAILVVDASEGVKAQTKEVVLRIKSENMPVIVALNKMDKPEANPEKVKRELSKEGILAESIGGQTPAVEISAKTKKGIPELLDLILLVAEMENLKADFQKPGQGIVIESYHDNLRGPTATLLLQDGVLSPGDIIATHSTFTKIKSVENFQKVSIEKAYPSDPIIVFGFNQPPEVGEEFFAFKDMESAENYMKEPEVKNVQNLEAQEGQRILNIILKTDVLGSAEAIEGILKTLPQEKVAINILKSEAGTINESDAKSALASRAIIVGFRVKTDQTASMIADRENVKIMNFDVIYNLVEGIKVFMARIQESEVVRQDLGKVKVLAIFFNDKSRQIVGGKVVEGEVRKGASIEVFRNDEKIGKGRMINLQRNKKDIGLVSKGDECGVLFEGDVKIEEGDILQFYVEERKKGAII